jgi:hypothetical protein
MATKLSVKSDGHQGRQIFGVPSLETATRIDNVDMVEAVHAAHYRLNARMRQLECEFDVKASELRQAFIDETSGILNGGGE